MTKKEFCLHISEQLLANPRKVLAGHGIPGAVLQKIVTRPDVMTKLGVILYSLKTAKRMENGLKKAKNFRICGYKNFAQMNLKAREDVEKFIDGLDERDQNTFNNKGNIVTIMMLPDNNPYETEDPEEAAVTGPAVMLPFDTAVRKEYKIPGGTYLVVMIGDSAIRSADARRSERLGKKVIRKNTKELTPAMLRRKLGRKITFLRARFAKNKAELAKLNAKRLEAQSMVAQQDYLRSNLGVADPDVNLETAFSEIENARINWEMSRDEIFDSLDPTKQRVVKYIDTLIKKGEVKQAMKLLNAIDPDLVSLVFDKGPTSGSAIIKNRIRDISKGLSKERANRRNLEALLKTAADKKEISSYRSRLNRSNRKINDLTARRRTYKNIGENKAEILANINREIEERMQRGDSLSGTIKSALNYIAVSTATKQEIKQDVANKIADGLPMQYAVQQAVQEAIQEVIPQEATSPDTTLTGKYDIKDLLRTI